jgi:hypothetical protein
MSCSYESLLYRQNESPHIQPSYWIMMNFHLPTLNNLPTQRKMKNVMSGSLLKVIYLFFNSTNYQEGLRCNLSVICTRKRDILLFFYDLVFSLFSRSRWNKGRLHFTRTKTNIKKNRQKWKEWSLVFICCTNTSRSLRFVLFSFAIFVSTTIIPVSVSAPFTSKGTHSTTLTKQANQTTKDHKLLPPTHWQTKHTNRFRTKC